MTWYYDITGAKTMDVWDHEGTKVAEDTAIGYDEDGDLVGSYPGQYPPRVKTIAREHMEGNQPSAYNQSLLADMATDNIERGPPDNS